MKTMQTIEKAKNPAFWQDVREKEVYRVLREELATLWKTECEDKPIVALPYSRFREYFINGNRGGYQNYYYVRRRALSACALLAMIYPEEECYLVRLMDEIYAICDEYTWCLPAHYDRLERKDCHRIDLFAAETGFALAEIDAMLGDRLEPLIRQRIRQEVERRIVLPYTKSAPYGEGEALWWEQWQNNWIAVCTASVAGAFMLLYPELVPTWQNRFDAAMEQYLQGFREDGICEEGSAYWDYGFGFFVVYADMVRDFSNGEIDYFKREKVKTIAMFLQKMFLTENCGVSFADSGSKLLYRLGTAHYLKNEYPDDVVVYSPKYSQRYDGCGRFCLHLRSALWLDEKIYNSGEAFPSAAYYAKETQWLVKRTVSYGFAAKGGNNGEFHNHNDVGSFIFAKNGRQLLADLGSGTYSKQYFSAERYTIAECSSRSHSVPIVNGQLQRNGKEYCACNTSFENEVFSTDLAQAYGLPQLRSLRRSFRFEEDAVILTDQFAYEEEGTLTERFVTTLAPHIAGAGRLEIGDALLTYDPSFGTPCIHSELGSTGRTYYCIDFELDKGVSTFSMRME